MVDGGTDGLHRPADMTLRGTVVIDVGGDARGQGCVDWDGGSLHRRHVMRQTEVHTQTRSFHARSRRAHGGV